MNLPVKPIVVVNPLPQYFNRRLSTILLLRRHIEVINKNYQLFTNRWTIHTAPASVRYTQHVYFDEINQN